MEREVPRVALDESLVVGLIGVQVFLELSVAVAGRSKSYARVERVAIVECPLLVLLCHLLVAHSLGGGIDGPVVEGILQGVRGGSGITVVRGISQLNVVGEAGEIAVGGCCGHGLQSLLAVDAGTFDDGICQNGHGMITRHAPSFVAHQTPYGQHAHNVLLLVADHRLHHVGVARWL